MSLTVIGTVALDSVSTPFGTIEEGLGGSATYFSVAASYFCPVSLVAVVGGDFPKEHLEFLKGRGIDLEGLQVLPGPSFRWKGNYDYDLNTAHTLETQLNVLLQFQPRLSAKSREHRFVFLANIDPKLQFEVIGQAQPGAIIAADTMNFWIEGHRAELEKTLSKTHMLVINEGEARLLSQEHNLIKASRKIREMGPKILLIKRGEYGALAFYEDQVFSAPALPLEDILDPTGAGDSFAGAVMGYLAKHGEFDFQHVKKAMIYGSVLASFNVERFSLDRLRDLHWEQIQQRYRQFCHLTHFDNFIVNPPKETA